MTILSNFGYVFERLVQTAIFKPPRVMKRKPDRKQFVIGHRRKPCLERKNVGRQPVRPHVQEVKAQDFERLAREHRVQFESNQQAFEVADQRFVRRYVWYTHRNVLWQIGVADHRAQAAWLQGDMPTRFTAPAR